MPSTIWCTISAVDRLRSSPACPVAQNGQFMPQPACERDAHGHPVRVAHQHGLDERAVVQPPQRLAGGVVVAARCAARRTSGRAAARRRASRARRRGCRSTGPGRGRTARSSAATAAWRGTASRRSRRRRRLRSAGVRSARCRGGFLAPRGATKVSSPGLGMVPTSVAEIRRGARRPVDNEPLDAKRAGQRVSRRSDEDHHQQPDHRSGRQQRVQPVHDAAVARQQRAHVLDAEVPLDHRLAEVAERGAGRDREAEQQALPPGAVVDQELHAQRARRHRERHRAEQALAGLARG